MKIIYITSRDTDYLQDLTYSGLVKLLGSSSVIDYPWNKKFHLPIKKYPKNLGYTGISVRIGNVIKDIDVVILASVKPDVLVSYQKLMPLIGHLPLVFIDGGDWPTIGGDFDRLKSSYLYKDVIKQRSFDLIFKREYIEHIHGDQKNVFPFPFSFPYQLVNKNFRMAKKFDVSFWAVESDPIRSKALSIIENKYDCRLNGTIRNQVFKKYKRKGIFYLEEIAACKIVLNFRGAGWDTMRYWEVPGTSTFMISQKPAITIPDNFIDGTHVSWCSDSLDDITDRIDYYLKHEDERLQMAEKSHKHLLQYHLNTHRAEYLIKKIKEIM
jgi:hypothetical protein